jgi:hypothetical protein
MPTFSEEASQVFTDGRSKSYGDTYLSNVRDNWDKTISAIGRDYIVIVGLVALFQLVIEAKGIRISVVGIEVDNINAIREFLPCLIAYFSFDLAARYQSEMTYSKIFLSAVRVLYPDLGKSFLFNGLCPGKQPISGAGYSKASRVLDGTISFLIFLAPPLYLIYAYLIQVERYSLNWLLVISAVISFILILYSVVITVESVLSTDDQLAESIREL